MSETIKEKVEKYLEETTSKQPQNVLFSTEEEAQEVAKQLQKEIDAPFVKVTVSTLGKEPTVMIKLSLDDKKDWKNNIFDNSRNMHLSLYPDPTSSNLDMFQISNIDAKKMRKQKTKSVKEAINKINKFIDKVK